MRFYFNSYTFIQSFHSVRDCLEILECENCEIMKRKFGMYENLGVTTLVLYFYDFCSRDFLDFRH